MDVEALDVCRYVYMDIYRCHVIRSDVIPIKLSVWKANTHLFGVLVLFFSRCRSDSVSSSFDFPKFCCFFFLLMPLRCSSSSSLLS